MPVVLGSELLRKTPTIRADKYAIGNYVSIGASDVDHIYAVSLKPEGVIYPDVEDQSQGHHRRAFENHVHRRKPRGKDAGLDRRPNGAPTPRCRMTRQWLCPSVAIVAELHAVLRRWRRRVPLRSVEHAPGRRYHLFGDGSVHFLLDTISEATYWACARGRRRNHRQCRLVRLLGGLVAVVCCVLLARFVHATR